MDLEVINASVPEFVGVPRSMATLQFSSSRHRAEVSEYERIKEIRFNSFVDFFNIDGK